MRCISCGTQLPEGAAYCPTCGALTPSRVSESGIAPYDPTAVSSPSGAPPQAPPATDYGSPPYGVPPQNPYEPLNPYAVPLPAPPPPPPQRQLKMGFLRGSVVLVLILASIGVFLAKQNPLGLPSPATTNVTTPTPRTPQDIYLQATSGSPVFNNPLNGQGANNWDASSTTTNGYGCVFTGGAYHVSIGQQAFFTACFAEGTNLSNFAFQVQMTILKGDGGGLLFRAGGTNPFGYRFFFGRGYYDLVYGSTILISNSAGLKANLNQTYLLTVIAHGRSIYLYVDKHWLASTEDSSASSGKIGLMAYDQTSQTEVVFRNAQVWNV